MFHKIKEVYDLGNGHLMVVFQEGITKKYDLNPILESERAFSVLRHCPELMKQLRVDMGGYGIIWNDDLDLSCDELWENGQDADTPFDTLLSFADAAELWNLDESTLRKAVARGVFQPEREVKKFGKQWIVTKEAMVRHYGNPAGTEKSEEERLGEK